MCMTWSDNLEAQKWGTLHISGGRRDKISAGDIKAILQERWPIKGAVWCDRTSAELCLQQ